MPDPPLEQTSSYQHTSYLNQQPTDFNQQMQQMQQYYHQPPMSLPANYQSLNTTTQPLDPYYLAFISSYQQTHPNYNPDLQSTNPQNKINNSNKRKRDSEDNDSSLKEKNIKLEHRVNNIQKQNKYYCDLLKEKDKIIMNKIKKFNKSIECLIDTIKKNNGARDGSCNLYLCKYEIIDKCGCKSSNCSSIHEGSYRYYIMLMLYYRDFVNKDNKYCKFYNQQTSFEKYIINNKIIVTDNAKGYKNIAAVNIDKIKKIGKHIYNNCFNNYINSEYSCIIDFLNEHYM